MTQAPDLPYPHLAEREDIALFLDIDGTLIEHKAHPEDAVADDALRTILSRASARLGGAVAFVTGRSIKMVDEAFAPLRLPIAGLYGLEHRLTADGAAVQAAEPADLAAVADALAREFHTTQGIYFERKGPVLAVHTRAAPLAFPAVKAAAKKALATLPEGYRIVAGHAGLEFLPVDALKSAAIERFMQSPPFAGRLPVFLGDDVADEAGFDYVNAVGGMSVRVRPRGVTSADYALKDVTAVLEWIAGEIVSARIPAGA
ncbi:MAG TPA: trehalose-phosphatase [Rhizobiaceae bacterium]|nr:trehalose-phosphatase [Rhizobiaceae bacterium]